MGAIDGSEWDTEYMADRVDIQRETTATGTGGRPRPGPGGQNLPTLSTLHSNVPCRIMPGSATPNRDEISDLSTDLVSVIFAQDVGLHRNDNLLPKPPSIGNPMNVHSYRHDPALRAYYAVCRQTS